MKIATPPAWVLPSGRNSPSRWWCKLGFGSRKRTLWGTARNEKLGSIFVKEKRDWNQTSVSVSQTAESLKPLSWKKVSNRMSSILLPRRWFLFIYLILGMNAANYLRPSALSVLGSYPTQDDNEQVHISLAGSNSMKITWITENSNSLSTVEYGRSPGKYSFVSSGIKTSYSFLLYRSGHIHSVIIGPLESETVYYYRCSQQGKEYSFKTPPSNMPITFAVVGDIGQTKWTQSTLNHVRKSSYDLLLFAGDLSYADLYQPRWDSFGRLVESSASSRPWMVTEGNHEIENIPIIINSFRAYNARWRMPYQLSGSNSNLYYSFEVAGSHIVMLGSYADYEKGSLQYKWLQKDLAKVDRKRTPWLIVMLHAPWYNSNYAHQGDGDAMMRAMEPILNAAKADILFAGHVHAYERWSRMYNGKADVCGMYHVTIGDGGNREGLAKHFINPQPKWSLFREASFGHGELHIQNSTHAYWNWHRNDEDEDQVADKTWINSLSDPLNSCSSPAAAAAAAHQSA